MKTQKIKISDIKTNPDNPRVIRDEHYKKLVKSITEFPQMLELRPLVVDENLMVLGGNMRLRAAKEAGLKELPVLKASELTEEQKKRFIIADNLSFGEWDFDKLANEWDAEELNDWGLFCHFLSDNENNNIDEADLIDKELQDIGVDRITPRIILSFIDIEDRDNYVKKHKLKITRKVGETLYI